jgi:hypothetical protein
MASLLPGEYVHVHEHAHKGDAAGSPGHSPHGEVHQHKHFHDHTQDGNWHPHAHCVGGRDGVLPYDPMPGELIHPIDYTDPKMRREPIQF